MSFVSKETNFVNNKKKNQLRCKRNNRDNPELLDSMCVHGERLN